MRVFDYCVLIDTTQKITKAGSNDGRDTWGVVTYDLNLQIGGHPKGS
jgi:hypothetical protein